VSKSTKKTSGEKLVNISIPAMIPVSEPQKRRPQVGDLAYSDVCDQSGIIVGESCGHYVLAYCDDEGDVNLCSGAGHQHIAYGPPPLESRMPSNIADHARMLVQAARYLHEQIEIFENIATQLDKHEQCPIPMKEASELSSKLRDLFDNHDASPVQQVDPAYCAQRDRDSTAIAGLVGFIESWREWGAVGSTRTASRRLR
jgi:hypothetical protein